MFNIIEFIALGRIKLKSFHMLSTCFTTEVQPNKNLIILIIQAKNCYLLFIWKSFFSVKFFYFSECFSKFYLFFIVVLSGGTFWHLWKFLKMYQIYHIWIHPLYHSPLSYHSPIPGIVSTGIIFAFTYMYTHFLDHIYLPTPCPHHLLLLTGTNPLPPSGRTSSILLFLIL
jgi:hypothetical protein